MSETIDQRVVEMRFDNQQFESGVQTSLGTLDKLKAALSFKEDAAAGLSNIGNAVNRMDLSGFSAGVDAVKSKFSALEVVGITALANITNSAVNYGKKIVKSLTIDPVSSGFTKYETKMNATQTIMASTGESLAVVNDELMKLNEYSDKTIYSFSDMTNNIGKFTNAGVKLEDATKAMIGISNEAAISGANTQEAARAMYNLGQALSMGAVKVVDWKSIENANMATKEFKQQLIDTAIELGTVKDMGDGTVKAGKEAFDAVKGFRDNLKDNWLTSEVLITTLGKYADETTEIGKKSMAAAKEVKTFHQTLDVMSEAVSTGWMQTWETIIGDFLQSKKIWTAVNNEIGGALSKSNKNRNDLLHDALDSKWDTFLNKLDTANVEAGEFERKVTEVFTKNGGAEAQRIISQYGSVAEAIKHGAIGVDTLREAFEMLNISATSSVEGIEAGLNSSGPSDQIRKMQDALVELGYQGDMNLEKFSDGIWGPATEAALKAFQEANNLEVTGIVDNATLAKLQELTSTQSDVKEQLSDMLDQLDQIGGREHIINSIANIWKSLLSVLGPIKEAWRDIFPAVTGENIRNALASVEDFTKGLILNKDQQEKLKETFTGVFSVLHLFTSAIGKVVGFLVDSAGNFDGLGDAILTISSNIGGAIKKFTEWASSSTILQDVLSVLGNAVYYVTNLVRAFYEKITTPATGVAENSLLGWLTNSLKTIWATMSSVGHKITSFLSDILKSMGDNVANGGIFSLFELLKTGALTKLFLDMGNAISGGGGVLDTIKNAFKSLISGSSGILTKIQEFFGGLGTAVESFSIDGKGKLIKSVATSLIILAGAMLIMASIPEDKLMLATGAIVVMIKQMTNAIPKLALIGKKTGDFIKFAAAIFILTAALKNIASLDVESMLVGLIGVSALMWELVAISKIMGDDKLKFKKMGANSGLIKMAAAIWILCQSLVDIAKLDYESLGRGLVGVSALLWELAAVSAVMQSNKTKFSGAGVSMIILAAAVAIMAEVLKSLSELNYDQLGVGGVGLTVIIGLMAAFAQVTKNVNGGKVIGAATGMVIMAGAMIIMAKAIKAMGKIKTNTLVKGMTGLAAALGIMAAAMNLLPKDTLAKSAGLVIAAAALNMLDNVISNLGNMEWESIGKALLTLGGALAALAIALRIMNGTVSGAAALMVAALAINMLAVPLIALSHLSIESLLVSLAALAGTFVVLGVAGLALGPMVPVLLGLGGAMLALGAGVALLGVGLVAVGAGLLAITANGVAAIASIMEAFHLILVDLPGLIPDFLNVVKETVLGLCAIIIECTPDIVTAAITLIEEFLRAATTIIPDLVNAALDLILQVLQGLTEKGPQIVDFLITLLCQLIEGIADRLEDLVNAGTKLVVKTIDLIIEKLKALGWEDMDDVIEGVGKFGLLYGAIIAANATFVPAFTGLLKLGVIAAELTAILAAFGGLNQIPGLDWLLNEGGDLLENLGRQVGKFIGGLVGGVGEGLSDSLPHIGSNLSGFWENAETFWKGMQNIDQSAMSNARTVVGLLTAITSDTLMDGLIQMFTGDNSADQFGYKLVSFGRNIVKFAGIVEGLNTESITAATNAGSMVAAMAKEIPAEGGLLGWICGNKNLTSFGKDMANFGAGVAALCDSINGTTIDDAAVAAAMNVGSVCAALALELPFEGGFLQWLMGKQDLGDFGQNMTDFGTGIKNFCDAVLGIDTSKAKDAIDVANDVITLDQNIPSVGSTNMHDFVVLTTFADQFKKYAETLEETPVVQFKTLMDAASDMYFLSQKLKATDMTGLENFQPGDMGQAMVDFQSKFTDMNFQSLAQAEQAIENMSDMMAGLKDKDYSGVDTFKTAASSLGESSLSSISEQFSGAKDEMSNVGGNMMDSLATSMSSNSTGVMNAARNIASNAQAAIMGEADKFKAAGVILMQNVTNGFKAVGDGLSSKALQMVSAAGNAIRSYYGSFHQAGSYIVQGLSIGIGNGYASVYNQGYRIGSAAIAGIRAGAKEKSPSKLAKQAGAYVDEGFILGMDQKYGDVADTAFGIGDVAVTSLSNAIGRISDVVSDNIDANPTITPVVDLDSVRQGSAEIDGLLNKAHMLGVNANVDSISANMVAPNQNGTSNDVVAAVAALADKIDRMPVNQYNINGMTYDDGTNISTAVQDLFHAARVERRI